MKKIATTDAGTFFVEMTEAEFKNIHKRKGVRKNVAYTNHKVGTVINSIERDFGLPKGCIRIVNPDGRTTRSDKLIRNVLDDYSTYTGRNL